MVEFALAMPFFLTAGLWGIELANFALTNMKVSQLAAHIADNASRIGDTSTLQNRKIYEEDINDLMVGANLQGGPALDFFVHGRAIVSSLQVWDADIHTGSHSSGDQVILWQRCMGALDVDSSYGAQNAATPDGIGPDGYEVLATADSPVIFVELTYEYQPLISSLFISNTQINATSAFMVRDDRDQSTIYKRDAATTAASCT